MKNRNGLLSPPAALYQPEILMGIEFDFSKLDAMDILDLACFFEQEAALTYEQLASWAEKNSADAAEFFERMVRLETAHDSQIKKRRRDLFGNRPSRYTDAAPWEVEMPDFDKVGASFTLEEAYSLALGAEERAEAYFRQALDYISDPEAVTILETLADEEREHQRLLKAEMARHLVGSTNS
jgi:rubrerythrin